MGYQGMHCRVRLLVVVWCVLLANAVPAGGASLQEVRGGGNAVGAEMKSLQRSGKLGYEQERSLLERLGPLVLAFIEQNDRLLQRGGDPSRDGAVKSAFEAIHAPLDEIYSTRNRRLQAMARQIMDEDGDLEALYETQDWLQSQAIAARSLYFLNWLDLYGARLFEGARRKQLLEAAERGFSEFAVGQHQRELLTESILGRGLCHLELGNQEWAARDFRAVIDDTQASTERKAKARLALLDSHLRAGQTAAALAYSEELLGRSDLPQADRDLVRFYRLNTFFDALPKAPAERAARYRKEAGALMEQLARSGRAWADKVDALLLARADDPTKWMGKVAGVAARWNLTRLLLQKEDFANATPLLEEIVAGKDPQADPFRPEAQYWLGVARLKSGDRLAAADQFDAALQKPADRFAAEAAYLRFKALEGLMEEPAAVDLSDRYAAALHAFLESHPDHPHAGEGRYRLGELQQTAGNFEAALDSYEKVSGDGALELRAKFASVQCRFEQLKEAPDEKVRQQLALHIGKNLKEFWEGVPAYGVVGGKAAPAELLAKATLLQAVYVSLQDPAGHNEAARLLDGFADRFPDQRELLPQAVRLRVAALRDGGRYEEAGKEVDMHAAVLGDEGRADAIEKLASSFVKAGAREPASNADAAQAARTAAIRLYDVLNRIDGSPDVGRQLTMARLSESTGDLTGAEQRYEELLAANPNSLTALSAVADVSEKRGDSIAALSYWVRYGETAKPGDAAWYRGQYHRARLLMAANERSAACKVLGDVRDTVAGLRDAELREKLNGLYETCD